jgi:hypothetical protein
VIEERLWQSQDKRHLSGHISQDTSLKEKGPYQRKEREGVTGICFLLFALPSFSQKIIK